MLGLYSSHHIPTSRNIKGRRACRTQTGFFMGQDEARRCHREGGALATRRRQLAWLVQQWDRFIVRRRMAQGANL